MAPGWAVHDGAAVLLRNNEVMAAIEEERLNRIKHSNFFPARAIRSCLEEGGLDLGDVDCVAMNFAEQTRDIFPGDIGRPAANLYLEETERRGPTVRNMVEELFIDEFGVNISEKLYFCHHHIAHLWSAWGPAAVPNALAVSFDGSGDGLSGMVAIGRPAGLDVQQEYDLDQSLGNLYADTIRLLGYRRFDEYKAMGLAPYGDPDRFDNLFRKFYQLLPDGNYWIASRAERWAKIYDAGLISKARRKGEQFTPLHADFAASLQRMLEVVAMHVLSHFQRVTGQRNLCYAGGVAHNCTLNGKILYSGMFDSVFVQPAAHDAGGALGAALAAAHHLSGSSARIEMNHVFTGKGLKSSGDVSTTLKAWQRHITVEHVDDPAEVAAKLLADGLVIGWVQGRSEFGPRALGHRSILADPRPASNKDRINSMVKRRESFRPFAPSIRVDRMTAVFELPQVMADYSYMTYTLRVHEQARAALGAVTHVDGTARVQSVSRDNNPRFWDVISEFEQLTGVPAILNTSFNNNAEPIVDSIDEAVACFLTTGLDVLVIDEFVVKRRGKHPTDEIGSLRPRLASSRKLVRRAQTRKNEAMHISYYLESTASRYFVEPNLEVSEDLFYVLLRADGRSTLEELYQACHIHESCTAVLNDGMYSVWEARGIVLIP